MAQNDGIEVYPALRVSQIDSGQLDNEITEIVEGQFDSLKAVLPLTLERLVTKMEPEIRSSLKMFVWWFSIRQNGATLGQQLTDMRYVGRDKNGALGAAITRRQSLLYFCTSIFCPYLLERADSVLQSQPHLSDSRKRRLSQTLARVTLLWEALSLLHCFLFLNRGGARTLLERLLGLRAVHSAQPTIGTIDFTSLNRELIWNGFADVLLFLIPLVNVRKLWNAVQKRRQQTDVPVASQAVVDFRTSLNVCPFCADTPVLPFVAGCTHCFCYYCLWGNLHADSGYCCPTCDVRLSVENLRRVSL